MNRDLPSRTVTFLLTGIEGSTPLWDHEPERMRPAEWKRDKDRWRYRAW